jgi:hypothetical protein
MRRVSVALATLGLLAVTAGPVSATIVESGKGSFDYGFTETELCAFDVEVTGSGTFNFRIRQGKNTRDQAFFLQNVETFDEQLTAGDAYVTVSARGTFNETRAIPLGDGVFRFHDLWAGTFTLRDADGGLLVREAGVIRRTYTFDTLNDDEPGGEVIGEVEETLHGRFSEDADAIIRAALEPS